MGKISLIVAQAEHTQKDTTSTLACPVTAFVIALGNLTWCIPAPGTSDFGQTGLP